MFSQNYQSKSQLYAGGAAGQDAKYTRRQRQRMNFVSVIQCLFIPWVLFCISFGVTSFSLHFTKPWLCWTIIAVLSLGVLGIGSHAFTSIRAKMRNEVKEPNWCIFLFLTSAIAIVCGVTLGNQIFNNFTKMYYNYQNLNDYKHVDVSKMRGEQLMDGARLGFTEGTALDLRKTITFKNMNTYCVAPITVSSKDGVMSELTNYDFWAVGMNCCSDDNADFHCGEYNNPKARSGLRLLEDDERAFYRLAVQQAEAMYHVKATHPLFVYWTEDPVAEMTSWKEDGYKYFFIGMIVHFCWQALVVGLGVVGFSKMGMS